MSFPLRGTLEVAGGTAEEEPDLRLEPLLVSSSESFDSGYEDSESDSSVLMSSELEGAMLLLEALEFFLASATAAKAPVKPPAPRLL